MNQQFNSIRIHKHNYFQKLYPTVKIVACLFMLCDIVILLSWKVGRWALTEGLLYSLVPLALLIVASDIGQKSWPIIKAILYIVILVFLFQTFLMSGGKTIYKLGPLLIHQHGLQSGVALSTFILNVSLVFIWLFQSTEVHEFTYALEQQGLNRKIVYLFSASLQNIEVIKRRARRIQDAQEARGIRTHGNLLVRLRALSSLIIPLLLSSVINSADMSLALEARCFNSPQQRTHLVVVKHDPGEKAFLAVNIICTAILLVWRWM